MEISIIVDPVTTITTKSIQINSQLLQIDAISSPPATIKPKTAPKKLSTKRRRIKKASKSGNSAFSDSGGDFFDGGDGSFGGNGGGSGGNDDDDGFNFDDSDPAFDFVYEMLCWIVLSNCLHFSVKKMIRILAHKDNKVVAD